MARPRKTAVTPRASWDDVMATPATPESNVIPASDLIEVFNRTPLLVGSSVSDVLRQVGELLDSTDPIKGTPLGILEWVADGHRFTLAIDPVEQ